MPQHDLPLTPHDLPEAKVRGKAGAEHEGVDEEPDQAFDVGPVAVRRGDAHNDGRQFGVAEEQRLEGGQKGDRPGRLAAPGEVARHARQVDRDRAALRCRAGGW